MDTACDAWQDVAAPKGAPNVLLVALAASTGQLARVFLWDSFVTSKEVPNDLDVLLVMTVEFAVEEDLPGY